MMGLFRSDYILFFRYKDPIIFPLFCKYTVNYTTVTLTCVPFPPWKPAL